MFETAELGRKISKKEYNEKVPLLRQQLLEAQGELRQASFPVIVLFAGVDGAGKGEMANLLSEWMDPRWIVTRAFDEPSEEESERPEYWRFWRDLPPTGHIGIFLSAWYSKPLLNRVYEKTSLAELDKSLDQVNAFEKTLVDDRRLILKYWMHLGKNQQKQRLKSLEKDPLESWRITKRDWKHWKLYDRFIDAAERIVMRTSTGEAPWTIVEGADPRYRSLTVGSHILSEMSRAFEASRAHPEKEAPAEVETGGAESRPVTILSQLDSTKSLESKQYRIRRGKLQARLNQLHRRARSEGRSMILVFEGWDSAGKGGAIRRVTRALDARAYEVIAVAAPTDEERAHHYLWRFWRHLPRAGRVTIFDRSWYGRVLVERVEGFASGNEWRRAYAEINAFERQLVEHGIVLVKFWIHITPEEQAARFATREQTPYKRWKLTDEDWRNRDRWAKYEIAVHDMVQRTNTPSARWNLVEGNDKKHARVKVLDGVCNALARALDPAGSKGTT